MSEYEVIKKKKKEFSKKIMNMEMALLWVNTLGVLGLAYLCVLDYSQ